MNKPRALDLFCGAGGATRGLQLAGFHVTGVDIKPQPHYCGDAFVQADALAFPLDGYDLVWASPPCQGYSIMRNLPWLRDREYPLLIGPVRERLQAAYVAFGTHWIVENVMGAVTAGAIRGGWLCGGMFGLPVYRHRVFETSFPWLAPGHPIHRGVIMPGRMLNARARLHMPGRARAEQVSGFAQAIDIDWMSRDELQQAIPPAYSRYLAEAFLATRQREAVA